MESGSRARTGPTLTSSRWPRFSSACMRWCRSRISSSTHVDLGSSSRRWSRSRRKTRQRAPASNGSRTENGGRAGCCLRTWPNSGFGRGQSPRDFHRAPSAFRRRGNARVHALRVRRASRAGPARTQGVVRDGGHAAWGVSRSRPSSRPVSPGRTVVRARGYPRSCARAAFFEEEERNDRRDEAEAAMDDRDMGVGGARWQRRMDPECQQQQYRRCPQDCDARRHGQRRADGRSPCAGRDAGQVRARVRGRTSPPRRSDGACGSASDRRSTRCARPLRLEVVVSETDDCKRPWDHGADYYSTSDQDERLTHEDLDECLEDHFETTPGRVKEVAAKGVTVYTWARMTLDEISEAERQADDIVERLSEAILEEYGDPNGSSEEIFGAEAETEFKLKIMPALVTLLSTVTPWGCSQVGERTFTAEELLAWVREHNPEWLE